MTPVSFKLREKPARALLADMLQHSPWFAREPLAKLLERMTDRGISVSVDLVREKHTDSQRGYYHMCLDILAKAQGYSHDGMHDVILSEAFGSEEFRVGDHVYRRPTLRSSKLDVTVYSELIETLMRVAAFCGVVLPSPEQVA